MHKKLEQVVATVVTIGVIAVTQVPATTTITTVTLPKGGYDTVAGAKSTGTDYGYCSLYDVYPPGEKINERYQKVKVSFHFGNKTLDGPRVIYEGTGDKIFDSDIDLKKGNYVFFKVQGNDPDLAAKADMYFDIQ